VIIAAWNAADVLGPCLDSLERQAVDGGFETIVVDNASTDHTSQVLAARGERVRALVNERNAGFSQANNQGASEARGEVLVFLNSDTELLAPDVLEGLAKVASEPDVGLAGPMLVNPDGSLQPSCAPFPTVPRALLTATGATHLLPPRLRARFAPHRWAHDRPIDTDWLMGAVLAMRADVFEELGGFWPATEMYAEEKDLAHRVAQHGLRVRFVPSARVMHVGNHSNAKRWSDAERAAVVAAADLTFLRVNYSRPRTAAIRAVEGSGYAVRALVHGALGRRRAAAVFRAMAAVYARPSTG
jgi:GT2 family glycosyltransferase